MPKFRKKPVVIDAVLYNGWEWVDDVHTPMFDGSFEGPEWLADAQALDESEAGAVFLDLDSEQPELTIVTLEGNHLARVGDWIIRGIAGELYPCKPDIFEATYELAE